jgi:hypothetical protein
MGAALPDAESDGQPNAAATGDDNDGGDDEDGVVFLGDKLNGTYSLPCEAGETGGVQITVGGAISTQVPAYLHGWFDWN